MRKFLFGVIIGLVLLPIVVYFYFCLLYTSPSPRD